MSLCSTGRMPCRHSRSETGRGPGAFSGQGGSSGSISAHRSSSTIHGRVVTPSRTVESSHRTRPNRAVQQDRVTSSLGFGQAGHPPVLVVVSAYSRDLVDAVPDILRRSRGTLGDLATAVRSLAPMRQGAVQHTCSAERSRARFVVRLDAEKARTPPLALKNFRRSSRPMPQPSGSLRPPPGGPRCTRRRRGFLQCPTAPCGESPIPPAPNTPESDCHTSSRGSITSSSPSSRFNRMCQLSNLDLA